MNPAISTPAATRSAPPSLWESLPALDAWLAARGEPSYRARQVRRWLFERRATTFAHMSDLSRHLRQDLEQTFRLWALSVARHERASDGSEKLLFELADGQRIESVLLRDGQRRTICISTQVGCAMGCVFCASGLDGVVRNLTAGEIVEQILVLNQLLTADERLSHLVVMGMGEPLANLDALLAALHVATGPDGLAISARRVTISTVGLPPAIRRLARCGIPYHLAVSLHAPHDELRNQLVPVNRKIGLEAILEAADDYFQQTGRRLTFEYVLLADVNDQRGHAIELARRLTGRCALVNLIPYNPVSGLGYRAPHAGAVQQFVDVLRQAGLDVQVRQRKGDQIDAACGQLRRLREGVSSPAREAPGDSTVATGPGL